MIRIQNFFNRIEYFIALLFVYCNGSWLFFSYKNFFSALMVIVLVAYLLLYHHFFKKVTKPKISILILAFFPLLSMLVNISGDINFLSTLLILATYLLLGLLPFKVIQSILDRFAFIIY